MRERFQQDVPRREMPRRQENKHLRTARTTVDDHGRQRTTMVDHGRPWSTKVDPGRPWSTAGRPWSTSGRPWSTMVDRGRPLSFWLASGARFLACVAFPFLGRPVENHVKSISVAAKTVLLITGPRIKHRKSGKLMFLRDLRDSEPHAL